LRRSARQGAAEERNIRRQESGTAERLSLAWSICDCQHDRGAQLRRNGSCACSERAQHSRLVVYHDQIGNYGPGDVTELPALSRRQPTHRHVADRRASAAGKTKMVAAFAAYRQAPPPFSFPSPHMRGRVCKSVPLDTIKLRPKGT
jgi:hypothetical protein